MVEPSPPLGSAPSKGLHTKAHASGEHSRMNLRVVVWRQDMWSAMGRHPGPVWTGLWVQAVFQARCDSKIRVRHQKSPKESEYSLQLPESCLSTERPVSRSSMASCSGPADNGTPTAVTGPPCLLSRHALFRGQE